MSEDQNNSGNNNNDTNKKKLMPENHPFLKDSKPTVIFWGGRANSSKSSKSDQNHTQKNIKSSDKNSGNDPKNKLLNLSIELNKLMSKYVKGYNNINTKKQSNIEQSDQAKYFDYSLSIKKKISDKSLEITNFQEENSANLSQRYQEYLSLLNKYSFELYKSTMHFSNKQRLLYSQSQGFKINKNEINETNKSLNLSLEKLSKLGETLTNKAKKNFDTSTKYEVDFNPKKHEENRRISTTITILRWITFLPLGILIGILAFYVTWYAFYFSLNVFVVSTETIMGEFFLRLASNGVLGITTVLTSSLIVPKYRKKISILTCLVVFILSISNFILGYWIPGSLETVDGIIMNAGAIYASYEIHQKNL